MCSSVPLLWVKELESQSCPRARRCRMGWQDVIDGLYQELDTEGLNLPQLGPGDLAVHSPFPYCSWALPCTPVCSGAAAWHISYHCAWPRSWAGYSGPDNLLGLLPPGLMKSVEGLGGSIRALHSIRLHHCSFCRDGSLISSLGQARWPVHYITLHVI